MCVQCLGKESDDVDIALDDTYGEDFAKLVTEYLNKSKGEGEKKVHFGVIQANADKGKHLETATLHMDKVSVDLVNLRAEDTYTTSAQTSPRVGDKPHGGGIGTPKEDAFRRDLTVNSLFYNINEGKVEDFTGMGL